MNVTRAIGEVLQILIGAALAVLAARTFLVLGLILPCRVTSDSMEPTIQVGQRLIVDRTAYWFRQPHRWEVIVFRCLHEPGDLCVKRVAGLPGERVQIRDSQVFIDGQPQPAPQNVRYGPRAGQEFGDSPEYTLGPGEFFVLGDNSLVSEDSRVWTQPALPEAAITGRAMLLRGP